MVLLVHGIVDAPKIPSQGTVVHGNLAAICSPILGDVTELFADPDRVAELAVAHNDTLCKWAERTDVLPLRIGTICSDETGVVDLLAREAERFQAGLDHVHGAVELGIRITQSTRPSLASATAEEKPVQSGRDFLKNRAKAVAAKRAGAAGHDALINELVDALKATARDMRQLPSPAAAEKDTPKRIFDGAFLVPRDQVAIFNGRAGDMEKAFGEKGLSLSLNGPWPAYNFLPEAV